MRRKVPVQTEAGKGRCVRFKHVLTAKALIIVGENADDFDELRAELLQEYDPQSTWECELSSGSRWLSQRTPSLV